MLSNSVISIGSNAFRGCYYLTSVYYAGIEDDWTKISIGSNNDIFADATRYYYSENEPALNSTGTAYNGNYWYYDDNNNVVKWKYKKENN